MVSECTIELYHRFEYQSKNSFAINMLPKWWALAHSGQWHTLECATCQQGISDGTLCRHAVGRPHHQGLPGPSVVATMPSLRFAPL